MQQLFFPQDFLPKLHHKIRKSARITLLTLALLTAAAWVSAGAGEIEKKNETADKDFWVYQSIAPDRLYVGQEGTYIIRFFRRTKVTDANVNKPELNGFAVRNAGDREYEEMVGGIPYRVTEMKFSVFPERPGRFGIFPVKVKCSINVTQSPFLLEPPREEAIEILSNDLTISVQTLPERTKEDGPFSGLVGKFSITAELEPNHVLAGDAITLTVKLAGKGNVLLPADLNLPELPGFKAYRDAPECKTKEITNGMTGAQIHRWGLVAEKAGDYTIPAVSCTYFDPASSSYCTIRSQPIRLEVQVSPSKPACPQAPMDRISHLSGRTSLIQLVLPAMGVSAVIGLLAWKLKGKRRSKATKECRIDSGCRETAPEEDLREMLAEFSTSRPATASDCMQLKRMLSGLIEKQTGAGVKSLTSHEISELVRVKTKNERLAGAVRDLLGILDRICFSGTNETIPRAEICRMIDHITSIINT